MAAQGVGANLIQLLPRAELREGFPRRSQEEYVDALRQEMDMTNHMVYPESIEKPRRRLPIKLPEFFADGGGILNKQRHDMSQMDEHGYSTISPLGTLGMTAYHGSPHKFDKFSLDKIGTGEGAQAWKPGEYQGKLAELLDNSKMAFPKYTENEMAALKLSPGWDKGVQKHGIDKMFEWAAEKQARESQQIASAEQARQAEKIYSQKFVDSIPTKGIGQAFNQGQIDSIASYRMAGDKQGALAEARYQAVNSIKDELDRLGVPIEKISQKDGGNSIYARVGNDLVRVSDHALPNTPTRTSNQEVGRVGGWNKEVLTDDWDSNLLQDYINQIIGNKK